MNFDSNSILGLSLEGFDTKMLLDPFEEQLDLPSVSIKQGDILSSKFEVIYVVSKGVVQRCGKNEVICVKMYCPAFIYAVI